jgi:hypothetical protein
MAALLGYPLQQQLSKNNATTATAGMILPTKKNRPFTRNQLR